jgi:aspartate aminotransferase
MTQTAAAVRLADRALNLKPSATLAVTQRVRELKAQGKDVIGFGAGEPDFDTPSAISDAAIESLRAGMTHYAPVTGTVNARTAIAEKLQRENDIACTPDDIIISAGAKHSVYLALQALVNPGDDVLMPVPAWVSYRPIIELCGGNPIAVHGGVENDFRITPQQLADAITPNTTAMLFNSPSNPCGTMYAPDEIRALADVLAAHDSITLISDEIYEKLIYGGIEHLSPGSIDAIAPRTVTVNGLSKAYAMTGWRLGYACAPGGDRAIVKAMARLQGQMTTHVFAPAYAAIVHALTHSEDAVAQMREQFARRGALMHSLLTAMPSIQCPTPTGAFYCFPRIADHFGKTTPAGTVITTALEFARALLEEANVAVVPGDDFDGPEHVRLSFACRDDDIQRGCERLHAWLERLR